MEIYKQLDKCDISIIDNFNLLEIEELSPELFFLQGFKLKTYKVNATENSKNIINNIIAINTIEIKIVFFLLFLTHSRQFFIYKTPLYNYTIFFLVNKYIC